MGEFPVGPGFGDASLVYVFVEKPSKLEWTVARVEVTQKERRLRGELSNGREYVQTMRPWGSLPARALAPSWHLNWGY